jgi:hypothetical protein
MSKINYEKGVGSIPGFYLSTVMINAL